jgi:DNA-binding MarR family transcriptional regulator
MTLDQTIQVIQVSFPQIYLACHTRHQRKRTTDHALSARDSSILAHLDLETPTQPSKLAIHLGVSRSTVSEALKRLTALGFVERKAVGEDARTSGALLSQKGAAAIRDTSVLEADRLRAALELATSDERDAIALGLSRLADACRRFAESTGNTEESQ